MMAFRKKQFRNLRYKFSLKINCINDAFNFILIHLEAQVMWQILIGHVTCDLLPLFLKDAYSRFFTYIKKTH